MRAWPQGVSATPAATARRGFTLLELMLVLAVLVVIAAITIPSLYVAFAVPKLRSTADLLRAELYQAKNRAMSSGRIHAFTYEPGGSGYRIEPWIGADDFLEGTGEAPQAEGDASQLAQAGPSAVGAGTGGLVTQSRLPDGVIFYAAAGATDSRDAMVQAQMGATGPATGMMAAPPPILFYADGQTSDVELMLANQEGDRVVVTLRGLTGIAHVGEVMGPATEVMP